MSEPQIENFVRPTCDDYINNRITDEQKAFMAKKIESEELERKRIEAENLKKRCEESYEYFYQGSAYLPSDAINRKIDDLKKDNLEIYQMVSRWNVFGDYGFCMCGPVGTGKTYALTTILNFVARSLVDANYPVTGTIIWRPMSMLLEELKDSFNEKESILKKIGKFQDIRFLFIDDIGAHKITEFDVDKIISILDYRVNHNLPTFFSTNCKIDQMKATFGERIFSRIIATAVMVEVKGKDRRLDIHSERLKHLKGTI